MERVIFIAEVGVNHNGSVEKAKKLIDAAVAAGADIVKFQTFKAEQLVTKSAKMAEYQEKNTQKVETQFQMLKKLELSFKDFTELKHYCDSRGVEFLSTGFDVESLNFLLSMNPSYWKVPSGEITNLPYLEFMSKQKGIIFISTGMSTIEEVQAALNVFKKVRPNLEDVYVMHCTSQYPAELEDINLKVLETYKQKFGQGIGYSDHSMGIEVSLAAVALGAKVIEKHITLDTNDIGPDHKASITVDEFKQLVLLGKNISLAIGKSEKVITEKESKTRLVARKSIVAKSSIRKGETFTLENLTTKRPGEGISPMRLYDLIGKKATIDYIEDDLIIEKL